ncbi:MAG: hypothetical protein AAB380_06300, partial [Verrucomicrobiota bacterium]
MKTQVTVGLFLVTCFLCGCGEGTRTTGGAEDTPKPGPGTLFVATNGNDAWSGRLAAPNRPATDGPFATLPRALAAAREFKVGPGSTHEATTIWVRGGTYFLTTPLVLTPEDSNLKLMAYPKERPAISGGRRITGWKEVTVAGKKLWTTEIPEAREGKWFFREL